MARRRRGQDDDDERNYWPADPRDRAAAEVAAAILLRVTGRPKPTPALFLDWAITAQMASTINWRFAHFIDDDAVWSQLDAALADSHTTSGPLSHEKLIEAIDSWVTVFDPLALRRTRYAARSRSNTIGDRQERQQRINAERTQRPGPDTVLTGGENWP